MSLLSVSAVISVPVISVCCYQCPCYQCVLLSVSLLSVSAVISVPVISVCCYQCPCYQCVLLSVCAVISVCSLLLRASKDKFGVQLFDKLLSLLSIPAHSFHTHVLFPVLTAFISHHAPYFMPPLGGHRGHSFASKPEKAKILRWVWPCSNDL